MLWPRPAPARAMLLALASVMPWHAAGADGPLAEEIVVTAPREPQPLADLFGNTARVDQDRIRLLGHTHVNQLASQAAGTWVSRGTEQESLPAIRSPVLTGPGSCGAFLMLEDGIPIRPPGFCNVNELFEIPTEQAAAMEVVRGPASALYGANGLHGTLNFLLPSPGADPGWHAAGEWGPNSYWRTKLGWDGPVGEDALAAGLTVDHDGDFRDSAGYSQAKGFLRLDQRIDAGELQFGFTGSGLDQQTAGYIVGPGDGKDAYKDEVLREENLHPDSFRHADSQRLYARWIPAPDNALAGADLRVFLRRSAMDFLQDFLPGTPREENGQWSGGLMATDRSTLFDRFPLRTGIDLDVARGFLKEIQDTDAGIANRPAGKHYDYEAWSFLLGAYGELEVPLSAAWTAQLGLRFEYMLYEYDNRMLVGNTRDDGTPCTPAPCLFTRPADRSDGFFNVSPNVGLRYRITEALTSYLSLTHGFRPPQATELYRLQAGQTAADLNSETLDSAELGVHWGNAFSRLELAGFLMKKHHFIFQNADRYNVSDGTTRHRGVEIQAEFRLPDGLYSSFAGTYARHTYAFTQQTPGELITSGNYVDTAPRTLASMRLGLDRPIGLAEFEWEHVGSHFINAANTAAYPGHNLLNFRMLWRMTPRWTTAVRLNNVLDRLYAERADFAFGQYRYFPGREREFYVELAYNGL